MVDHIIVSVIVNTKFSKPTHFYAEVKCMQIDGVNRMSLFFFIKGKVGWASPNTVFTPLTTPKNQTRVLVEAIVALHFGEHSLGYPQLPGLILYSIQK